MLPKTDSPLRKLVLFATSETDSFAAEVELKQMFPDTEVTVVCPAQIAQLLSCPTDDFVDWHAAITWLRQQQFNASVILNGPDQSPYVLGYLCYLAILHSPLVIHEFWWSGVVPTIYVPFEKRAREGLRKSASLCSLGQSLIRTLTFPFLCRSYQNLTSPLLSSPWPLFLPGSLSAPALSPWLSFSLALFLPGLSFFSAGLSFSWLSSSPLSFHLALFPGSLSPALFLLALFLLALFLLALFLPGSLIKDEND